MVLLHWLATKLRLVRGSRIEPQWHCFLQSAGLVPWGQRRVTLNPVRYYRVSRWLYIHGVPLLPGLVERLCILICHCYLPAGAEIGEAFEAGHWGFGIVIHPRTRIGRNVFIDQGVTIGGSRQRFDVPRIADNVFIGAGARILGDIDIGEGSLIAPNSVVVRSVPPKSIVSTASTRVTRMPARLNLHDLTGWPPWLTPENCSSEKPNLESSEELPSAPSTNSSTSRRKRIRWFRPRGGLIRARSR